VDLSTVGSYLGQAVLYLGGGAVIVVAAVRWAGDRLATRLEQSWHHENDRQLEALKGQIALQARLVESGSSTMAAAYLGALDRRIEAVEALWAAVIATRKQHAPVVSIIDMIPPSAIRKELLRDLFPASDVTSAVHQISKRSSNRDEVEVHRPFLSQEVWVLFRVYRAFESRVLIELVASLEKDEKLKSVAEVISKGDDGPHTLLRGVLSDAEIEQAQRMPIGQFQWLVGLLEQKMLAAMTTHLTGVEGSSLGFDEASRLLQQLNAADNAIRSGGEKPRAT
jgi:hypothetical protein